MQPNIFPDFAQRFPVLKCGLLDSLRRMLARWGLVLFRFSASVEIPPSLVQYLKNLSSRRIEISSVLSFDDEAQIQKELLTIFPMDRVSFISGSFFQRKGNLSPAISLKRPDKRFMVEIDIEACDFDILTNKVPWLFEADIILIRATLGFFWSGKGDLCGIVNFVEKHGFDFFDITEYFQLRLLDAPSGRIIFIFEKRKIIPGINDPKFKSRPYSIQRIRRINQALTFLSEPIAKSNDFTPLAGRGSLGFKAGILNPGAISDGDRVILLARGEHIPWAVSKRSLNDFMRGSRPILFELNNQLNILKISEVVFLNAKELHGSRLEDFRLFRHNKHLFSNHSKHTTLDENPPNNKPTRFTSVRTGVGISQVNAESKELTFLGTPTLDFPIRKTEKNWAMFEHQNELFLIYSFNPFCLLRAANWPQMNFTTVVRQPLKPSRGDDQLKFRNSINPVDYDQENFLHMVHKVYPDKQYAFWAVLIDKNSLLPKKMSARPLICGWKSAPASIIYACSVIVRKEEILIFGGLQDSSLGFWKVSRQKLDENWIPMSHAGQ